MSLWDQDFVDAETEGYFQFSQGRRGEFQFGYVCGAMTCEHTERDGRPAVEWSWEGNDEMDPASGRGWAKLAPDGSLRGRIYLHTGDASDFTAVRPAGMPDDKDEGGADTAEADDDDARFKILRLPDAPPLGPPAVDLARHRRRRQILRAHQNSAVDMISPTAMRRCARRLGLLEGNDLRLESESESIILKDHIIYDHRERGRSVVDRYLAKLPPADDPDEKTVHNAMAGARFSVFRVVRVVSGLGVFVDDALRGGGRGPFVVDENLSRSATPGFLLAARLLPMGDYACCSGAAIPISGETLAMLQLLLEPIIRVGDGPDAADTELRRQLETEVAIAVIAAGLEEGGGSRVKYVSPAPPPTAAGGRRRSENSNRKSKRGGD
jgi:hypothetical protein